jgi:N-acetylmuramoyl-L-alanine amidase
VQRELVALGLRDRGVKPIYDRRRERFVGQKLWVLRKSRRPAVLIECAFLTNPREARLLGDDLGGFRERLAVAIFRGLRVALVDRPERRPAGRSVHA